jgi:hypothetical protein
MWRSYRHVRGLIGGGDDAAPTISFLENYFRNVHCLGIEQAAGRLLQELFSAKGGPSFAAWGMRPREIDRIGPSAVSATQREVAFPEQ